MSIPINNALTVDVEDYFHVSAFARQINPSDWRYYESRVERNTHKFLDIFDDRNYKATFFVLGWVVEQSPQLVREIGKRGHEVACHGYIHQLVYEQTPEVFRQDTLRAKALLEDVTQRPVCGYRAASFSITKHSTWALDILAEIGFSYDSSIFPVRHDRYGMPEAPDHPYRVTTRNGQPFVEFPLTVVNFLGYRLPIAGGGYFRLYPYPFTRWNLRRINRRGQPFVFYLHPWELDPDQPRIPSSVLSTFRHYINLHKCEARLARLLNDFQFMPVKSILHDLGLLE